MPGRPRKRILVVDDSAIMRGLLRAVICSDDNLEVVGTATDGRSALGMLPTLGPDLILLDVEMPVMDGLSTLRELRLHGFRLPVIMCSSLTQRGAAVTIEALAGGASDYVAKPSGQVSMAAANHSLAHDLLPKIHALTSVQPQSSAFGGATATSPAPLSKPTSNPSIVVIGVSTGGPAALDVLLSSLPAEFPVPIVIVQHMPEVFTRSLADHLNSKSRLRISEAKEGTSLKSGDVWIARGNWHLEILPNINGGLPATLHMTQNAPEHHCRPAVDVLFRSTAAVFGADAVALVMTGMGSDGLIGARAIRTRGGTVLAQDEATSAIWGMPGAVVRAGVADRVLPLQVMASELLSLCSHRLSPVREAHEVVS